MENIAHLTQGHSPTLTMQIAKTWPGMAHWAASGPPGETCADCMHLGYQRQGRLKVRRHGGCARFLKLTGKHGPRVPPSCGACRHFEPKPDSMNEETSQ